MPETISNVRIVEIEEFVQTQDTRRRHRSLAYLPLTCTFRLLEVDLRSVLSPRTMREFAADLNKRAHRRRRLAEKKAQERSQAESQRPMFTHKYLTDLASFPATPYVPVRPPTEEDFPQPNTAEQQQQQQQQQHKSDAKAQSLLPPMPQKPPTSLKRKQKQKQNNNNNNNPWLSSSSHNNSNNSNNSNSSVTPDRSFLDAVKSQRKKSMPSLSIAEVIGNNVPSRKTSKGKEFIVLSLGGSRRK
jgi:hypothetical protein